jgi:hypothetical protein
MTLYTGFTGYFSGYTVTMLERLILWELGQVSGTTISYDRFPRWLVRQKLTDRQNIFAYKSKCLRKYAFLVAKDGYKQYRLPLNCMDKGVISIRYYIDSTTYEDIELRDTEYLDEHYSGWLTADSGTPEIAYMGNYYGNIPTIGIYPAPDADGTNYALDPETGICIGGDLPAASNNYTGEATGGGATTLTDTGTTFTTLGLTEGMYVRNTTDGCYAYITVIAANSLTLSTLTGGTLNVFTAGDSYEILAGEYGVITSWENDDQYIFGAQVGSVSNITIPAGNFRVEYIPYPLPFSFDPTLADASQGADYTYPDIPKLYHQALVHGVVADFLMTFHEASKEFSRASTYEQKFNEAITEAMMAKNTRPFDNKEVYMTAKRRRR